MKTFLSRFGLALLALAVLTLAANRPAEAGYWTVNDLGLGVYPFAINDSGQATGYLQTYMGDNHTFLYSGGRVQDIGTMGTGFLGESVGVRINNNGQIIGTYGGSGGYFDGSKSTSGGYLYNSATGAGTKISGARPSGLNDAGQVAGYYPVSGYYHNFTYINGQFTDIGAWGQTGVTNPPVLNNSGQIAGSTGKAFISGLDGKKGINLGFLGQNYYSTVANGINDAGQVVGYSATDTIRTGDTVHLNHAFLYTNGKMTDLNVFGGAESSATDINNKGQIIGTYLAGDGTSHAFLYENGTEIDLTSILLANGGWTKARILDINNEGQIVGYGQLDGKYHGFVMADPVPVPPSLLLFGSGLLGLVSVRLRKAAKI